MKKILEWVFGVPEKKSPLGGGRGRGAPRRIGSSTNMLYKI